MIMKNSNIQRILNFWRHIKVKFVILRATSISDNYQWQNLFSISSPFLTFDSLKFERYFSNSEKIQKVQKYQFRDILERFAQL